MVYPLHIDRRTAIILTFCPPYSKGGKDGVKIGGKLRLKACREREDGPLRVCTFRNY